MDSFPSIVNRDDPGIPKLYLFFQGVTEGCAVNASYVARPIAKLRNN